jgi:phosphohistidine phosphatase
VQLLGRVWPLRCVVARIGVVRRLYLLRHAKSSWEDPALADFERPLAPRGRKAAKVLAGYVEREGIRPELVLCSPARRARETLERLSRALGEPAVTYDERLYGASETELLTRLREVPGSYGSVLLVGHNPGTAQLLALLAGGGLPLPAEVPTGALASLSLDASWPELEPGAASLDAFVVPRELG